MKALSYGIGLIAATTFTVNAYAAPCFENNTPFEADVWHMERGEKMKFETLKAGEKGCAAEDREGFLGVAIKVEEPPYIGQVKVGPNGLVKVMKDSGGYFLVSVDEEGNQIMKVNLAQPRN